MNYLHKTITYNKNLHILFLGDMHIGNKYYNQKYLDDALSFVDAHRDSTRIVLMGDMMESATKSSVGRSVYDDNMNTNEQFEYIVKLLQPYADNIDLILEGNHEERIMRDTSLEIVQMLCHRLGRIDAYGKFSSVIDYTVGDYVYTVYAWHGNGGGRTEANAIKQLLDMRQRSINHIYAMGHTHYLFSFTRPISVADPSTGKMSELEQLFLNTGSALDYGGYPEQKGLNRISLGYGMVDLSATKHKMVFSKVEDLI